jgi:hypothetical protein
VWISEPDYSVLYKRTNKFSGSFLYLIKRDYDTGDYKYCLSGCSALQALVNITNSNNILVSSSTRIGYEPFGRGDLKHPIKKLQNIDALYLGEREIETIYRLRYNHDE